MDAAAMLCAWCSASSFIWGHDRLWIRARRWPTKIAKKFASLHRLHSSSSSAILIEASVRELELMSLLPGRL